MSRILAAFFDPGDNGIDISDLAIVAAFLVGPLVIVIGWFRIWGRRWLSNLLRPIVAEVVAEYTKPIQPATNGGKSLPDTSKKLDLIIDHLGIDLPDAIRADD